MALKLHPEQNESINECPASEEEPASDKADPLSVKKRVSFVGNYSSNGPASSAVQIVSDLYKEKENEITRQCIEIRN